MSSIDNSAWSRNGDFIPTRYDAQIDATHVVSSHKRQMNPENTVGLMTMGGEQIQVLVTPCSDEGKILAGLHGIKQKGKILLSNALQIAQLSLKHRANKNLRQRIIAFVASPIEHEEQEALAQVGKKLRKNNVALDIVNIGEYDPSHVAKLEKLIEAVNNDGNSHFVNVQPGTAVLSDTLISSPILMGADGGAANAGDFGQVEDPELAMAIRMSLEEAERTRRADEEKKNQEPNQTKLSTIQEENVSTKPLEDPNKGKGKMDIEDMAEEELLKRAKEISMENTSLGAQEQSKPGSTVESVLTHAAPQAQSNPVFENEDFINELLKDIPDLDRNSPEIKALIEEMKRKKEEDQKKEAKKDPEAK